MTAQESSCNPHYGLRGLMIGAPATFGKVNLQSGTDKCLLAYYKLNIGRHFWLPV